MPTMTSAAEGDTGRGLIDDHTFAPAGALWDRCWQCGMAAAAHTTGLGAYAPSPDLPYRCPDCVERGHATCAHRRERRPEP
jgi:hypothetical protein